MEFDPATLNFAQTYKLMTGAVVPRPIAWVTTLSGSGLVNLAPFSSFTFVSHDPPMLAIGIDAKPHGDGLKDTGRNILQSQDFVIHIAHQDQLAKLHASAADMPENVSEVEQLGLHVLPSVRVRTPRLKDARISMECRLHQCIELGRQPTRLMIGEVLYFHVHDDVLREGRIDSLALNPVCRLAGPNYAILGEVVNMASAS